MAESLSVNVITVMILPMLAKIGGSTNPGKYALKMRTFSSLISVEPIS